MKIRTRIKQIAEDPFLNLVAGIVLVFLSLVEVSPTLLEDIKAFNFGSHHGVSIFGVWHIFKVLPDCLEGLERIFR